MQDAEKSSGQAIGGEANLVGFAVVGGGESIGKVDHVNYTGTCLSVQTGGLLTKTKHLIPATAIRSIDLDAETVDIALTAEQVADAPEYDEHAGIDEECETRVEQYYKNVLPR
jgi:hypothetical protein